MDPKELIALWKEQGLPLSDIGLEDEGEYDDDAIAKAIGEHYDTKEEPNEEVEVVDTTDGVDPNEEDTLYEAIMELEPEAREALIARVAGDTPSDPEYGKKNLDLAEQTKSMLSTSIPALAKQISSYKV